MKYRGIAIGIQKDGHGIQAFFSDFGSAVAWARTIARSEPCAVEVYEITERLCTRFEDPKTVEEIIAQNVRR